MSSMNESKRFHPYSQNNPNNLNTRAKVMPTTSKAVRNTCVTNENYEHQSYLNSVKTSNPQRNAYPTLLKSNQTNAPVKKGILKDRTNTQTIVETKTNDPKDLKIWSVTTKSMQIFANRFDELEKNSSKNTIIDSQPGNYLFEIIGQLDSIISQDISCSGAREFSIKDSLGRIHCVFYEIDRSLERYIRDCWIRCIGKFNQKKKVFQCVSVRLVKNESELFAFGFQVNQTNAFIKSKYFK